jgi:hypothetical protein
MKKFLLTLLFGLFSIAGLMAQPMPNQNPHNSAAAATSAPTQNSISTASVDTNQVVLTMVVLAIVAVLFFVQRKKMVKA